MDALVVYDSAKLPQEIRELQNVDCPLPAGAQFFEEEYVFADVAKHFIWGLILVVLGTIVVVGGGIVFLRLDLDRYSSAYERISSVFGTIGVAGLVMFGIGYFLLKSAWPEYKIVRRQQKGLATRQGIFLVGDVLIDNKDDVTRVVPKAAFRGLKDRQVQFEYEGETRTFSLPTRLVGADVPSLDAAVAAWAA